MKLVFATNNPHKLREVQEMLGNTFELLSLADIGCEVDIPETADTLEGNALQKAQYIKLNYGYDVFADDTGLEVDVLAGAPGVYSARYAGLQKSSEDNMDKLLAELQGKPNRRARFRTAVALIIGDKEWLFEGIAPGEITAGRSGEGGFGYDPIFRPDGYEVTFAAMSSADKNRISHRGKAIEKLVNFLKSAH